MLTKPKSNMIVIDDGAISESKLDSNLLNRLNITDQDLGQLFLGLARLDTPTSPNVGGSQVSDEFDDATGIASNTGSVAAGYLTTVVDGAANAQIANFTGATGNFGISNGTVSGDNSNTGVRSTSSISGDMSVTFTYGGFATTQYWKVGIFPASSLGTFTTINTCNLPSMSNSYWLDFGASGATAKYGTTSPQNFSAVNGDVFKIARSGGTVTIYKNGTAVYTFPATNTEVMYVAIGHDNGTSLPNLTNFKYGGVVISNITTISNAYTAKTAPSTATLVVEYQDVATTSILNTDIIFDVSRDNGTTWTAVNVVDFGPSAISGARVLTGSASISAQPTGTAMKWRVRTFNNKEQRVHGIWMQWK